MIALQLVDHEEPSEPLSWPDESKPPVFQVCRLVSPNKLKKSYFGGDFKS